MTILQTLKIDNQQYSTVSKSHLYLVPLLLGVIVVIVLGSEVHHLHEVVLLVAGVHVVAVPGPRQAPADVLLTPGPRPGLATPNTSLSSASDEDKVANFQDVVIGQV